jgi:RNA polymerase sigma factor (sigma-70 family)
MPNTAPRASAPEAVGLRHPADDAEQETARLYAEYGAKIYRHCLGQLRSHEEAEDAVQNTFLRVHTALRRGVVPEFEAPWLYKIAHNVCLSRRLGATRRARVETPHDLSELEWRTAGPQRVHDELFGLDDALAGMPTRLRRAILLREWQGLSYAEIAVSLGTTQSAVETLIFRARRHLARALERAVVKPVRKTTRALNAGPLIGAAKALFGGAGAMKLAAGAAVLAVALIGGVEAERAVHRHLSGDHAVPGMPSASAPGVAVISGRGIDASAASVGSSSRAGKQASPHRQTRRSRAGSDSQGPPSGRASSVASVSDGASAAAPNAARSGDTGAAAPRAPAPAPTPSGSAGTSSSSLPSVPLPSAPAPTLPDASLPAPTLPAPSLPDATLPQPTLPTPTLPAPTLPETSVPQPTLPLPTETSPPPLPTVPTLP